MNSFEQNLKKISIAEDPPPENSVFCCSYNSSANCLSINSNLFLFKTQKNYPKFNVIENKSFLSKFISLYSLTFHLLIFLLKF